MSKVAIEREDLETLFARMKKYIEKPSKVHAQGLRQQMRLVKGQISDEQIENTKEGGIQQPHEQQA